MRLCRVLSLPPQLLLLYCCCCPTVLVVVAQQSNQSQCDPCASAGSGSTFRVAPGSSCKRYAQCVNGKNMGYFSCSGDTVYDEAKQYCDWPYRAVCVETTCPPSATPPPTGSSAACINPCPIGYSGNVVRPGTKCKTYVNCVKGNTAEERQCPGDTIFNADAQYCDWAYSVSCDPVECPDRSIPVSVPVDVTVTVINPDDSLTPNPTTPQPSRVGTPQPQRTPYPLTTISINVPGTSDTDIFSPQQPPPITSFPVANVDGTGGPTTTMISSDCDNPCPSGYFGRKMKPGTNCRIFVSCVAGEVDQVYECLSDHFFVEERGSCEPSEVLRDYSCPRVTCADSLMPPPAPVSTPVPSSIVTTMQPTQQPTAHPTTVEPTIQPTTTFQYMRSYLLAREDIIKSTVLQSQSGEPSSAYTFPDLMSGLEMAVFQLPSDKAFYIGEGTPGRLPNLPGLEYGLVNLALFLSNAMVEGIRIDSCDEWNEDYLFEDGRRKYPIPNSCGQYGRSYQDEICDISEPFECALDMTRNITAAEGNEYQNVPPFSCRPREFDGLVEVYPGYYDDVDKSVVQSAYSNTLGRTDIESCCWWGRGVLLTRGRCITGKLDQYIGQGAADRGVYVFPDINFCANPEIICTHEKTNELRWIIGYLEWSDRVQNYEHEAEKLIEDWTYLDQLIKYVDGGMEDDDFINEVINIVTRNCHHDSCEGRWNYEDEENNAFEETRRDNFHTIISEIFNLPITYSPTASPSTSPYPTPVTPEPTRRSTNRPTRRNKGKNGAIEALPPNSTPNRKSWSSSALFIHALFVPCFYLWWNY